MPRFLELMPLLVLSKQWQGDNQQGEAARVYPVSVKVFIGLSAAGATKRAICIHGTHKCISL